VKTHYSGEVENIKTTTRQTYLGQYVQNFIRIGWVLYMTSQNILVCFFRLTVPTAVHLQNANANFHKVV